MRSFNLPWCNSLQRRSTVWSNQTPVLTVLLCVIMLFGCVSVSKPVQFYTLNPIAVDESVGGEKIKRQLNLGLGPIALPEMLDRPQIVTRVGKNRVQLAEFDRWADSLHSSFSHTLAESLSTLLKTEKVFLYPWEGDVSLDYRVIAEVSRFEAVEGQNAILKVHWKLHDKTGKTLKLKQSTIKEPINEQNFELVVEALNRTLNAFSLEVADAIIEVEQGVSKQELSPGS